jgi:hypothetical protein
MRDDHRGHPLTRELLDHFSALHARRSVCVSRPLQVRRRPVFSTGATGVVASVADSAGLNGA